MVRGSTRRWPARVEAPAPAASLLPPTSSPEARSRRQRPTSAPEVAPPALKVPDTGLAELERIHHALNRLGYGPRPGDVERVRAMGLTRWLESQLDPGTIDDSGLDARLAPYSTLHATTVELLTEFPPPVLVRAIAARLRGRVDEETLERIFPEFGGPRRTGAGGDAQSPPAAGPVVSRSANERAAVDRQRALTELSQAKLLRAIYGKRQLQEVMTDFWFNHFNVYSGKGAERWLVGSYENDVIRPRALGKFRELLGSVAGHPAMVFYLDNWLSSAEGSRFEPADMERYASEANHRNGLPPGGVATLILRRRGLDTTDWERRIVQRERARRRAVRPPGLAEDDPFPGRSGLNENYARELLELHTLGVDGGYTQRDVVEVARCFTGWTLLPLHAGQQFEFVKQLHDRDPKVVLGQEIRGKGIDEGEAVLDLLAAHPSTARFVCSKLARRFVSDEPPTGLVERMTRTFRETDGDIAAVLRTLFTSPEFWSPDVLRAKVKTPFEFVVSAVRALDAEVALLPRTRAEAPPTTGMDEDAFADQQRRPGLLTALRELGQPPYGAEPPTGYADTAGAWVSSGSMLRRMKLGVGLSTNRVPGVRAAVLAEPTPPRASARLLVALSRQLLGAPPSSGTLEALAPLMDAGDHAPGSGGSGEERAPGAEARVRLATGWLLAGPEFQRR